MKALKVFKSIGFAVWTGFKIIIKSAFLLPIPVFMVWFNYTVDRSGLFHGDRYNREIAQAIIEGHNINQYEQLDERGVLLLLTQNLKEPYDTLSLGSSRALMLRSEITGGGTYFSGGVSGADMRDIMGTYYLFDKADMLPQNLILVLDPWLLYDADEAFNLRADINLYNEFLSEGLNIEADYVAEDIEAKYRALLSPSYFQGNVKYYFRDTSEEKKPLIIDSDIYNQESGIKLVDGSVLYGKSYREAEQQKINERMLADINVFALMQGYRAPVEEPCELFEKFIAYVKEQGVSISFVLEPYHPMLYTWAREHSEGIEGYFTAEEWYREFAAPNDIPVYGSYNPFVLDFWEEDFYDGLHPKSEELLRIYPGVEAAKRKEGAGKAGKPFGGAEISWQTADRLVCERYEIELPHITRQGDDVEIYGEDAFLVLRYDKFFEEDLSEEELEMLFKSREAPVLLAKYAVTKSGVVYRLDTDADLWVEDVRFPD